MRHGLVLVEEDRVGRRRRVFFFVLVLSSSTSSSSAVLLFLDLFCWIVTLSQSRLSLFCFLSSSSYSASQIQLTILQCHHQPLKIRNNSTRVSILDSFPLEMHFPTLIQMGSLTQLAFLTNDAHQRCYTFVD